MFMVVEREVIGRSYVHLPAEKFRYSKLLEFVIRCRENRGIPLFRTRYASVPIYHKDKRAIYVVCWGASDKVRSTAFYDVPEEVVSTMESMKGEWKWILAESLIPEEVKERLLKRV